MACVAPADAARISSSASGSSRSSVTSTPASRTARPIAAATAVAVAAPRDDRRVAPGDRLDRFLPPDRGDEGGRVAAYDDDARPRGQQPPEGLHGRSSARERARLQRHVVVCQIPRVARRRRCDEDRAALTCALAQHLAQPARRPRIEVDERLLEEQDADGIGRHRLGERDCTHLLERQRIDPPRRERRDAEGREPGLRMDLRVAAHGGRNLEDLVDAERVRQDGEPGTNAIARRTAGSSGRRSSTRTLPARGRASRATRARSSGPPSDGAPTTAWTPAPHPSDRLASVIGARRAATP